MAIIKCKSCGGTLEITDQTVATCEYCGLQQTLPKLNDERKANLYDRANHFRRNNEFDKAMGIYEQVLTSDPTDAESYWSLVLCRFGIEYVEDPATRKRIPTVNRAQYTSIFDDDNYKSALQYADGYQRQVYEEEAKAINEIQKGILAISQKEEPFDVFICYKETDNNGRRTQDSVLANDLYHQLTQEGFKVFFARITLEDKLGSAYEPYIFAALNSAKVMVVLGTKPEHFTAVWVRNEWSRYLSLIKGGAQKTLIPAYRDMDPYDLPEEFSHLQAQDMSKLGFMQDLIRGIKKIAQAEEPKPAVVMAAAAPAAAVAPLLRRAFMFLEDKDWAKTDEFCEQVLNQEPENGEAYLGKLMAKLQVSTREALRDCAMPFDDELLYQKAVRFGDNALVNELKGYISHINERNENARLEGIYQEALQLMQDNTRHAENAYRSAAQKFASIPEYKDAEGLRDECLAKAEAARKDVIYDNARGKMRGEAVTEYEAAIKLFERIPDWKDSAAQIQKCQKTIEYLLAKREEERLKSKREAEIKRAQAELAAKKKKRIGIIVSAVVAAATLLVAALYVRNFILVHNQKYDAAVALKVAGKYEEAIAAFEELNRYKDSLEQIMACETAILDGKYDDAIALMDEGKYDDAYDTFVALNGHKDSTAKANAIYNKARGKKLSKVGIGSYIEFGSYEQDNVAYNGKEPIEWLVLAKENDRILVISRYALDCKSYNDKYEDVTWETCSLRDWLNNVFLNEAFNSEDQAMIPTVTVTAHNNGWYGTNSGKDTLDKVFLLSLEEASEYYEYAVTKFVPTAYAKQKNNDQYWWGWLRTPGDSQTDAVFARNDGIVLDFGEAVYNKNLILPAMWISLDP